MVFWSNTNLCHLCLAVAWDSGLTYFLRNTAKMSSKVYRFAVLMLRENCRAFLRNSEWKWFIFIVSVISGGILIIVWKTSSKSSNFSDMPSNVSVVLTWRTIRVCADGQLFMPTSTSARRLIGSEGVVGVVVSRTRGLYPETRHCWNFGFAGVLGIAWDVR